MIIKAITVHDSYMTIYIFRIMKWNVTFVKY